DLHIPGCPPPPIEILKGLIALLEGANGRAGASRG
ncbi:MAG: hydrogenase, partial [Mesorhizobium sp.]